MLSSAAYLHLKLREQAQRLPYLTSKIDDHIPPPQSIRQENNKNLCENLENLNASDQWEGISSNPESS